jgi:hypothetical protein
MKIEIDLNDILHDENYGGETISESVRRQVIDAVKKDIEKGIKNKIDSEVQKIINELVLEQVRSIAPGLLNDLIDLEYQPVTSYGSKDGSPTTLRKKFIEVLKTEFIYKKGQYDSDKNAFTRSVDSLVSEQVSLFKKEYNSKVDEVFTQEALNYATLKMKERLGIK